MRYAGSLHERTSAGSHGDDDEARGIVRWSCCASSGLDWKSESAHGDEPRPWPGDAQGDRRAPPEPCPTRVALTCVPSGNVDDGKRFARKSVVARAS